ncbi:response regulator [bacterium]|nr:response regulator [bacterium]
MLYLNVHDPKDKKLLQISHISLPMLETILAVVRTARFSYYQLSEMHAHFFKMLSASDMMLNKYPAWHDMSQKEKLEWVKIKDLKIGDRSYVKRQLFAELKKTIPQIFEELIRPRFFAETDGNQGEILELSEELDALLLASSIPSYFEYLENLTVYKKGVFSQLRRGYISFLQVKAVHMISRFLEAFEQEPTILANSLLNEQQINAWPRMGDLINRICDRADPNHHDPLSLHAINCLRSIYISVFNIAMELLMSKKQVPLQIRQFLPIIPDRIGFTRDRLERDDAWERYRQHHFLFMQLPVEQKTRLMETLSTLTPTQRVMWMGCLGKDEIRALILPMMSQGNHLENLALACREVPASDSENYPFTSRVWEVLGALYAEQQMGEKETSAKVQQLFAPVSKPKPSSTADAPTDEEADLSVVRDLTFLVVDDSDRIRQMTIKVLKDAGVKQISEAGDGEAAWVLLQKKPLVDVILCDWIMPKLTGIELVKRIMQVEELARNVTFLMLTTVDNKASIVEALSVGVRGYLIKPFSRKQLLDKVYFATEWLRREQQQVSATN